MNRRNRTLIVVALAVALASIASFGVYRAIESIPVREISIAKTFAVVATKPVPVGTMLAADDLESHRAAVGLPGAGRLLEA